MAQFEETAPSCEPTFVGTARAVGQERGTHVQAVRIVGLLLLSVLGFFAVAAPISALIRARTFEADDLRVAFERAFGDPRNDVVFIGTSHYQYGLSPPIFDQAMKDKGFAVHSFDVGIVSLSFVELDASLRQSIADHPCCAKYIFIEPEPAIWGVSRQPNSIRAINFYSLANAYGSLSYIERQWVPPPPVLSLWQHLTQGVGVAALRHYTNAGLFQIVQDLHAFQGHDTRGYYDRVDNLNDAVQRDPALRRRLDDTVAGLNRLTRAPPDDYVSPYEFDRYLSLLAYLRSKGKQVILLKPPHAQSIAHNTALIAMFRARCPDGPPLWDFSVPERYPQFYDPANHFDVDHLNHAGATLLTQAAAEKFAALLGQGGLPDALPACLAQGRS